MIEVSIAKGVDGFVFVVVVTTSMLVSVRLAWTNGRMIGDDSGGLCAGDSMMLHLPLYDWWYLKHYTRRRMLGSDW